MHHSVPDFIVHYAVVAALLTAVGNAEPSIRPLVDGTSVTVGTETVALIHYRYGGVAYKPYIDRLCTPAGVNVVRDSPSDHKHHHGLMFAVTVDGVNFWEEHEAPGREQHLALETRSTTRGGVETVELMHRLSWVDPRDDSRALAVEDRAIELHYREGLDATLLTWNTRLSLPEGKEKSVVTGTHYHGLGMRFVESMDKGNEFLNADGGKGVEGTNDVKSAWCAYSAEVDGAPVTVAVFDDPGNRARATWFTMNDPFSYISATLEYHRTPIELGELSLRYGVALWDGKRDASEIQRVYEEWVALASSAGVPNKGKQ